RKKSDRSKPVLNLEGYIWSLKDPLNGDQWTDAHDRAIRMLIEAPTTQGGYGIKVTDRDLFAAVNLVAEANRFHPVREKILSVEWDGVARAETLFIEYLMCDDNAYNRQASLLTLLGALTRIFEPGHKFDFVPILEGLQGKGKSTFIEILGVGWYSELVGDISNPQEMVQIMQGSWIMEIGELSAMARHEVNDLKAFVSRKFDKARLPYGKRAMTFPRQCIFVGSTNDDEYLRDSTGNRRYWPIVSKVEGMIDNKRLAKEILQIWAETYQLYRAMRDARPFGELPLYLTDEIAQVEAAAVQESRRIETSEEALAAVIMAWLDQPIGSEDGFTDLDGETTLRDATCLNQIWQECLGKTGSIPHNETMKIGKALKLTNWNRSWNKVMHPEFASRYGPTRIYTRPD
ncbi:virulence-associated E family protein, partial [Candidatus Oleimmundimicrobium sp.]|uniref:virulence-associated E family protein n=1 Tax=Candidatus Oleimmundimicrobium sp. TaxID=3060597 RepID=UPI00271B3A4B